MTHISSYPEIVTVGHRLVQTLLDGPVVVQEKVDGSQLSFTRVNSEASYIVFGEHNSVVEDHTVYEYSMRSKGQDQTGGQNDMFKKAWEFIQTLDLTPGWIYRGELLNKPKHNTLAYDRTPENNIVLFDIEVGVGMGNYLEPKAVAAEAKRLGLEVVPMFWNGTIQPSELEYLIGKWLDTQSFLGGQKIEGVVIKNYNQFTSDHKVMMAKYVSAVFKEVHIKDWKGRNPSVKDFVTELTEKYTTEARWAKAVQHLREAGLLKDAPQDIGPLLGEIIRDVKEEEGEAIKNALFTHFWKEIARGLTKGFPEFYKQKLLGNFVDPMQRGIQDEVERMENEGG